MGPGSAGKPEPSLLAFCPAPGSSGLRAAAPPAHTRRSRPAQAQTPSPTVPARRQPCSCNRASLPRATPPSWRPWRQAFTACAGQAVLAPTGCPMSDYAFFTGVTGMHWAVLTSPSKGGSQVSLDDDETVAVSGNYDASVSYSYQDPVTGGPARLMTGPAPTTPPSPHQLHAVRRLAVTVTTPGQVDSTRSGPCSGSTGLNRVGSAHYAKANFWG